MLPSQFKRFKKIIERMNHVSCSFVDGVQSVACLVIGWSIKIKCTPVQEMILSPFLAQEHRL